MSVFSFTPITYGGDQTSFYDPTNSLNYYDRVTVLPDGGSKFHVYHLPALPSQFIVTLTDAQTNAVDIQEFGTSQDSGLVYLETVYGNIIQHSAGAFLVQEAGVYGPNGTHFTSSLQDLFTNGPISDGYVTVYPDDTAGVFAPPPCYCAGTRILTSEGEVAVENLREGDCVATVSGALRPVRWIGHRHVEITRHPDARKVRPVRIRADAFGGGLPRRDLLLSPDHAVCMNDVLIPAKHLVNGATIVQDDSVSRVTYYHVELDRHDLILAEGLPAETYLDTGNRASFANADVPLTLHPDFHTVHEWDDTCRPMVTQGDRLAAARQELFAQAEHLGYVRRKAPEPRLVVDGQVIAPQWHRGSRFSFVLPGRCDEVRLVSEAATPAERLALSQDHRLLGLSLDDVVIEDESGQRRLALDDPAFTDGWHSVEREGDYAWRWTDGNALLRLSAPRRLEINVAGSLPRWTEPSPHPLSPYLRTA